MNNINLFFKSFLICFISTCFLLIIFIPFLKKVKVGQYIRSDGPRNHYIKSGTPTMGGVIIGSVVIFLFSVFSLFYYQISFFKLLLYILPLFFYMIIGFIDDYLIVVKRNNKGLKAKNKLLLQLLGSILYYLIYLYLDLSTVVTIFSKDVDLKWGYGLLILLMFVATSNAVNLSDGVDGLACGLSIICLIAISIIAFNFNNNEVLLFSIILIGGLMAFLCYNANPAKLFMGDSGSLMLGAVIANLMILLKIEFLLIVLGFVFLIETLSVIIQVLYFKITNGRRILLMSPLHHHFELKGYKEWEVDIIFWIIGIISAIVALLIIIN